MVSGKNRPQNHPRELEAEIDREERNAMRRAAKGKTWKEDREQMAFVEWARPRCDLVWHTPNTRKYSRRSWTYWKAMGVEPGIIDIFIFYQGIFFALEFKVPGKKPTKKQEEVMCVLEAMGAKVKTVYSFEEAKDFVLSHAQEF